jgi:hypothetical protein
MPVTRAFAIALTASCLSAGLVAASENRVTSLAFDERFLREAEVVSLKPIGVGITKPMKVTLRDGSAVRHAVWKTIHELKQGALKGHKGGFQLSFWDSYKNEIAAYELDKLLGLGLVPATVEREIAGKKGSLQLWVEGSFTELERREGRILPHDYLRWSRQMYDLRLLNQLIYNIDTENARNLLYDASLKAYAIDNSRSFLRFPYLEDEGELRRFSRDVLDRLRGLDEAQLQAVLGPWLGKKEIEVLLVRRDLLLEAAASRASRHGEATVFYP